MHKQTLKATGLLPSNTAWARLRGEIKMHAKGCPRLPIFEVPQHKLSCNHSLCGLAPTCMFTDVSSTMPWPSAVSMAYCWLGGK